MATDSTEQRLMRGVPDDRRRLALGARLELLEHERSKTAYDESRRMAHDPHANSGFAYSYEDIVSRVINVAYEFGLKMIDACLEVGVRDVELIEAHVTWSYERYTRVEFESWTHNREMGDFPSSTIDLFIDGAKQRTYLLGREVHARDFAYQARQEQMKPHVQHNTVHVTTGDGSTVQAANSLTGNQSVVSYHQVLERLIQDIEKSPMPEPEKRSAIEKIKGVLAHSSLPAWLNLLASGAKALSE